MTPSEKSLDPGQNFPHDNRLHCSEIIDSPMTGGFSVLYPKQNACRQIEAVEALIHDLPKFRLKEVPPDCSKCPISLEEFHVLS
ncbi:hypothetical protein RHMOL_Rhmol03G0018800 [Rhododendron molle]|uniref:Uncharacterized protein n=1 Tax=Rhododendron molle TaxID=49168 RepID=A0ACC0P964_RHOML|nr:hypothetical protein RHMOL_Rhmol03G0018800 [Rhododendron molle]